MNSNELTHKISFNQSLICLIGVCVFVLMGSYGMEFIFGLKPCRLCYFQRIPYFLIIIISAVSIFLDTKTLSAWILTSILLISFILASYHLAIQLGVVADPCAIKSPSSLEDYKRNIFETPIPCSKVSWSIFGIPLSAFNAIISLVCLCFIILFPIKKSNFS